MIEKKTYDLIFSIGEACSCTVALRNSKLQKFSYPFDWLYGCGFIERINLLTSKFEHFINIEDLEYIENRVSSNPCDIYRNNKNGLVFNHDFPLNIPLSKSYGNVKSKYERRIKKLLEHISMAKKVLVVYIKTPEKGNIIKDKTILEEGLKRLTETFIGTKFDILTLANDSSLLMGDIQIEKTHPNITSLTLNYKSHNKEDKEYMTNFDALRIVFSKFKLSSLLKQKVKINDFIEIKKLKRGFGVYFFRKIFSVMSLNFIFFGCRLDFCIGKVRE